MVLQAILLSLAVLPSGAVGATPGDVPQLILVANDDTVGPTLLRKIPLVRDLFDDGAPTDAVTGGSGQPPIDESYYEPEAITPAPNKPGAAKPATAAQKPATPALSCEKATLVVSSFGFSSVEASSCTGKIYAFSAKRDGRTFTIKLNSVSGELTEVRKLP